MRPYPWYEINRLTRELEPYAHYSASRVHFERCYQPETDQPLSSNGDLDVEALWVSVEGDEERYGWMSGDPIIRDIVHLLGQDPAGFSNLARINAEYMNGFRDRAPVDQARIHLMTACLLLGHFEDAAVTKKLLKLKAMELWSRARLRSEKKFSPSQDELDAAYQEIPPKVAEKFHWADVFRDLGLFDVPQAGQTNYTPDPTRVISWTMEQPDPPQQYEDITDWGHWAPTHGATWIVQTNNPIALTENEPLMLT